MKVMYLSIPRVNEMAPTTQPQTLDAGTPSTTAIEVSFHSGNKTHRPYILHKISLKTNAQ